MPFYRYKLRVGLGFALHVRSSPPLFAFALFLYKLEPLTTNSPNRDYACYPTPPIIIRMIPSRQNYFPSPSLRTSALFFPQFLSSKIKPWRTKRTNSITTKSISWSLFWPKVLRQDGLSSSTDSVTLLGIFSASMSPVPWGQ